MAPTAPSALHALLARVDAPGWSWDLRADFDAVTELPFMRNALWAGLAVAVMCGLIGWFVVLRQETFAAHTMSVVSFPGAAGAAYLGLAPIVGYFTFAVGAALAISVLTRARGGADRGSSAAIATVQVVALALGYVFVSRYRGNLSSLSAFLFGSVTGVTTTDVVVLVVAATVAVACLAWLGRPLLFASVDPRVAEAAGVPTARVGVLFLVLLGLAVAAASSITGFLLVFALLVAPPAAAAAWTVRPARALGLSVVIGVGITWAALVASYFTNRPAGFFLTTFGVVVYVLARATSGLARWLTGRGRERGPAVVVGVAP